jgi:hypothetical protein
MRLYQVLLKSLSAVTHLGTSAAFKSLLIAAPSLQVKVLGVLVTLPIILAAKGLVAGQEGAAIRPLVTLHVFLQFARTTRKSLANLAGDLVLTLVAGSRSKVVRFGRMGVVLLHNVAKFTNDFENLQGLLLSFGIPGFLFKGRGILGFNMAVRSN